MAKGTQNKDAAQAAASLPQDPTTAPVTGETPVVAPADETPAPAAAEAAPAPDPAQLQADAEAKAHADAEAKRIAEEAAGNQEDEKGEDFEAKARKFVASLTEDQADILFAELSAVRGSKAVTGKAKKAFKVVSPFRDSDNFSKEYQVGEDVSHLSKDRLKKLVELSLVEQK